MKILKGRTPGNKKKNSFKKSFKKFFTEIAGSSLNSTIPKVPAPKISGQQVKTTLN